MYLGIDCSGVIAELAMVALDGRKWVLREDTPRQADVIFPLLEKLLRESGTQKESITAIGAITGPGSFTGIRVGLALAQGLADGWRIPAYGLDAFTALGTNENTLVILESKRAELYVKYGHDEPQMLSPTHIKTKNAKIIHNISSSGFGPPTEISMAMAAAQFAQKCFDEELNAQTLVPYYVREADAKPSESRNAA